MEPRILVLSASVGAGHLRAAEAVESALRQVVPEATVKNLDVLSLTNAAFRRVYGKAYLDLVNKVPHVLGYFYDLLDRPPLDRIDRLVAFGGRGDRRRRRSRAPYGRLAGRLSRAVRPDVAQRIRRGGALRLTEAVSIQF